MKKMALTLGLIMLLSLVLAACGGGGGSGSGSTTLNVTMTDFKFDPSSWTVPAGKSVTVNIKNNGSTDHTWVVMSKPVSGSFTDADKANILFSSESIPAGQSKTVTFTAPSTAGNYQVICDIPGHFEAGMVGQLVVQ